MSLPQASFSPLSLATLSTRSIPVLPPQRQCISCADFKGWTEYCYLTTASCRHSTNTCPECLQRWISSELGSKGFHEIACPECPSRMNLAEMKHFASRDVADRLDRLAATQAVETLPNFRWCMNPVCEAGQEHETGAEEPIFRCHTCGHQHCVVCEVPWHAGLTCVQRSENIQRQLENNASTTWIDTHAKRCPNNECGIPIRKMDGCNHMTCTQCKHEFCWLCLVAYDRILNQGNSAHAVTCRDYRPAPQEVFNHPLMTNPAPLRPANNPLRAQNPATQPRINGMPGFRATANRERPTTVAAPRGRAARPHVPNRQSVAPRQSVVPRPGLATRAQTVPATTAARRNGVVKRSRGQKHR